MNDRKKFENIVNRLPAFTDKVTGILKEINDEEFFDLLLRFHEHVINLYEKRFGAIDFDHAEFDAVNLYLLDCINHVFDSDKRYEIMYDKFTPDDFNVYSQFLLVETIEYVRRVN